MNKRSIGITYNLTSQQKKWWHSNDCCPMCGLPEKEWKRRTDWRCCSKGCTEKLSKQTFYWQDFRRKAFRRDKWTCVKCGKKPLVKGYNGKLISNECALIGDHIVPIAIGGEEWDLKNIQTLCIDCDKIKTKQDQREIAKQRQIEKKQLNNKTL